jgi:hypothetical protein
MCLSRLSGLTSLDSSLHGEFAFQALAVASDSGHGECLPAAPEWELAVVLLDTAVQIQPVPSLGVTNVVAGKVILSRPEERHRITPEVAAFSRRTGTQLGGFLTESNVGDLSVRLRSDRTRSIDEVMNSIRCCSRSISPRHSNWWWAIIPEAGNEIGPLSSSFDSCTFDALA